MAFFVSTGFGLRALAVISARNDDRPVLCYSHPFSTLRSTHEPGQGDTVKIHYTGTLDDGMTVGESKTVTIAAAEAYGDRHDQLVQEVPRTALPEDMKAEIGMQLQSQNPDGQIMNLLVTEVKVESVTLDGNHPLAGQALTFAIELVEVA